MLWSFQLTVFLGLAYAASAFDYYDIDESDHRHEDDHRSSSFFQRGRGRDHRHFGGRGREIDEGSKVVDGNGEIVALLLDPHSSGLGLFQFMNVAG